MTADVDICNRALARAGTRGEISSLTEGSAESNVCAKFYTQTIREMLRDYRPKFARRQIYMADLGTPISPWAYRYAEPADLVVAVQVVPGNVTSSPPSYGGMTSTALPYVPFLSTGSDDAKGNPIRVICTNEPQAQLIYVTDKVVNALDVWDDQFMQAVEAALSAKIAIPLTGDKAIAQNQYQVSQNAIALARAEDGNENVVIDNRLPDWLTARGVVLYSWPVR